MRRVAALSLLLLFVPLTMSAETCPKVTYTNMASTVKDLVAVVNCLANSNEQTNTAKAPSASKAMQAEAFQIVGPQDSHTSPQLVCPQQSRPYPNLVMVLLTVPTGCVLKSAVVTPETRESTVTAEMGGSC